MFAYCADPSALSGLTWLSCYLTTGTHFNFYWSFVTVLMLLAVPHQRLDVGGLPFPGAVEEVGPLHAEAVEGARLGEAFEGALVDDAAIDAAREIEKLFYIRIAFIKFD